MKNLSVRLDERLGMKLGLKLGLKLGMKLDMKLITRAGSEARSKTATSPSSVLQSSLCKSHQIHMRRIDAGRRRQSQQGGLA